MTTIQKARDSMGGTNQDKSLLRFTPGQLRKRVAELEAELLRLKEEYENVRITEHELAEQALRESQDRYRRITDAVTDYIFTVHIDKGQVVKTIHGQACIAVTGYSPEEFAADPYLWFNMILSRDRERVKNHASLILSGNDPGPIEHRIRRKDGAERWVINTPVLQRDASGAVIAYDGLIRDITKRKWAEEEKAKLEALNRQLQKAESLGRMAGAIAHHFNNQLQAVMGNLEMAMDDLPLGVTPIESLVSAMQAARKAAEVSALMLTYLGQTPGKHEATDLSEACRQNLPMLRAAMPKDLVLETELPSPGPAISAISNQIQQVLTNLATNAWEAADKGRGDVRLTVKTVFTADIPTANCFPVDWQPRDPAYACLEVADAGSGIAEKDFERIFDPFFSTKFTGRGLGLPVVLGIVRAHHGAVTVESHPERGSIFRVFFPLSPEEILFRPDLPTQPVTPRTCKTEKFSRIEGGGRVLLVEDEEQVRNLARVMLARLGFTVLEARDGIEAVEIFQRHPDEIRCVLCDLTMPRMDGWTMLAALRKLSPGLPVILSSGYDKEQVMAGDHPEWPQAFLGKPYQLKALGEAIHCALANQPKGNRPVPPEWIRHKEPDHDS
jgi:two-component system, cell cycle sensor histidine kinase and response regulator CckA